jgi:carotenoid 1,2-hydratase
VPFAGPPFDIAVPPGGYRWWYVDGMSDCGRFGVVMIAFVGSVFSPWHHWAGRRDPEDHVAINVALYSVHGNRWAMTERGRSNLQREAHSFRVGPSAVTWQAGRLVVRFDETALPWPGANLLPRRMRGTITLAPTTDNRQVHVLDPSGRHHWQPVAPLGRIAVEIEGRDGPGWEGEGYSDANWGDEPLEAGFRRWDWSRGVGSKGAVILYDADCTDGSHRLIGLRFGTDGSTRSFDPPPRSRISRARYGIVLNTRCDEGSEPKLIRMLEDGPFYTRAMIETTVRGERLRMMHESYSGTRFSSPFVKLMLPLRMPRRA